MENFKAEEGAKEEQGPEAVDASSESSTETASERKERLWQEYQAAKERRTHAEDEAHQAAVEARGLLGKDGYEEARQRFFQKNEEIKKINEEVLETGRKWFNNED